MIKGLNDFMMPVALLSGNPKIKKIMVQTKKYFPLLPG